MFNYIFLSRNGNSFSVVLFFRTLDSPDGEDDSGLSIVDEPANLSPRVVEHLVLPDAGSDAGA